MIRFSAFLVAVAIGLLVASVVTSRLTLVYVAIGVSGVALLALAIGAVIKRRELFGQPEPAQPGQDAERARGRHSPNPRSCWWRLAKAAGRAVRGAR